LNNLIPRPPKMTMTGTYDPIELDRWFQNIYLILGRVNRYIGTLANDATPSVNGGDFFLTGGTTTITDFDDGVLGQVITIIAEHAITITDGTNIFLNGSANFVMAATDTLTLICKADNKWYEIGRSDNT
jgi:cyclophilin family peptidyl-prolyl cis-trans isomerase